MQKKILILTGASDGIGLDLALEFARRGYTLGLIARRIEKLQDVAIQCTKAGAARVDVISADVSDFESFRTALNQLDETLGGATLFIANAGIGGTFSQKKDNWSEIKKTNDVNFYGAVAGIELMKEKMWKRNAGTLVGISSIAATRGMPLTSGYSSGKAALSTYLESLRVETTKSGITTVIVEPGYIDTPLTRKNKGAMPFRISSPEAAKAIAAQIVAGKKHIVVATPFIFVQLLLKFMPRFLFDWVMSRSMLKMGRGDRAL